MTCCVCSRAYHAHVISETGCSTNPELLPETGSTEAHRLEETILFDKVSARKHFRWRHTKYWLKAIAGLTGKCRPEVIASLAARSHQPLAIASTQLRQSCVFDRVGPRPLCFLCAWQLARKRKILLLILRGQQVFVLCCGRNANLGSLRVALHTV